MKTRILSAALAVLTTAAVADESTLQCADADVVAPSLKENYGEQAAWIATDASGIIVTLFLNATTGTWAISGEDASGDKACMFFSGDAFSLPRPAVVGADG